MNAKTQKQEFQRNELYRDQYHRMLKWVVTMAVVAIGLTSLLTYMSISPRQAKFYATTTSGIVVPLHSLSQPVITNKYLLQWASLATRYAFNLTFVGYQQQLQRVKPYFSTNGWNKFMQALNKGGLLKTIESKKVDMNAVVSGAPIILNQSVIHGRYTWTVQFPLLVNFTSASQRSELHLIVKMNIQRSAVLNNPQGIQISDFVAQETMA